MFSVLGKNRNGGGRDDGYLGVTIFPATWVPLNLVSYQKDQLILKCRVWPTDAFFLNHRSSNGIYTT